MQALAAAAVFVVAGVVKGVTGMGLPAVAVSLLCLWMSPAQAAALLVLPALATNVAQCRGPHARWLAARLWPLWLGLALATVLAPAAGSRLLPIPAGVVLGAVLVAYGLWGLWRLRAMDHRTAAAASCGTPPARWKALAAGIATGGITAVTSVFVMPMVPYLQTLRLEKETMVQALGLSFTVATLALALRLPPAGASGWLAPPALLALAAAFAGLALGAAVRRRIGPAAFQRAAFIVFILLGLANLARAG